MATGARNKNMWQQFFLALSIILSQIIEGHIGLSSMASVYCFQELSHADDNNSSLDLQIDVANPSHVGTLTSAYYWSLFLCIPFSVLWLQLLDLQSVLLIAQVIQSCLFSLQPFSFTHSYGLSIFIRFMCGLSSTVKLLVIAPLLRLHFNLYLASLISAAYSFLLVGNAMIFPFAASFCTPYSWRHVYYILSGVSIAPCVLLFFNIRSSPSKHEEEKSPQRRSKHIFKAFVTILRKRDIYLLSIAYFLLAVIQTLYLAFIPKYYNDFFGMELHRNSPYTVIPFVCAIPVRIVSGFLLDVLRVRLGNVHSVRVVQLLTVALAVILICPTPTPAVTAALFSAGMALLSAAITSLMTASSLVEYAENSTFYALLQLSPAVASTGAPYLIEFATAAGSPHDWRMLMYINAGMAVTSVGCVWMTRFYEETKRRDDKLSKEEEHKMMAVAET